MKRTRLLALVLALIMALTLLAGCGKAPAEATTEATEETTEATTEATTEETTEETEPPVLYRNPLTGVPMDAPLERRIFAVSVNNVPAALPHVGTQEAGVIFEMYTNGYITRWFALFTDVESVETVGSVRSIRMNFTDIAQAYDTIVAHAGGSEMLLQDVYYSGIDHFNVDTQTSTYYSFRDKSRLAASKDWEHILFAKGAGLYQRAEERGIDITADPEKDYGFSFVDDGTPAGGEDATLININFKLKTHTKVSTLTYDEEAGNYIFTQYGKTADEVEKDKTETFENVFVMLCEVKGIDVYHVATLQGSGEGYYACGGKIIPILWSRDGDEDPFHFTLTDGTPLSQGVGNSYIAIVPTTSEVVYE